jgi:LytS/YehU family sensor histidine kinase
MLYESNTELVALEREIDCIKNYFDLQKTRLDESARIQLSMQGSADRLEIAPLLLMPLVENSFKHSLQEDAANTYIAGSISIEGDTLEFRLENSVGAQDQRPVHSGIGLDNLKRRLDLIYPGKHHFEYRRDDSKFVVDLKIVLR